MVIMEGKHRRVLNISKLGLTKLELPLEYTTEVASLDVQALIADENEIEWIENLEPIKNGLVQLSISRNKLTRTCGLGRMRNLRVLNLSGNMITQLDGLDELTTLEWLSLSGNCLSHIKFISCCTRLVHLDISDNQLEDLPSLSHLTLLHTLLMHGNFIRDLGSASTFLPCNLTILSLAENDITDLNQVKYLAPLDGLEQLSIMNNPCTSREGFPSHSLSNYRPFVVNWCSGLAILDGVPVTDCEKMKAEWLFSHGKGRSFSVGQHNELISYLSAVCPPEHEKDNHLERDEKLNKIYSEQQIQELNSVDNMRYKTDRSPRPRTGVDGKTTGLADNRSTSPTFPVHARVSEKEKRRRVHAWLGSQMSSDAVSPNSNTSPSYKYTSATRLPNLPVPELPSFATAVPQTSNESAAQTSLMKKSTSRNDLQTSDLLKSKTQFISAHTIPSSLVHDEKPLSGSSVTSLPASVRASAYVNKYSAIPLTQATSAVVNIQHNPLTVPLTSTYTQASATVNLKPEMTCSAPTPKINMDPTGGDKYCYVYDPAIAKAYTKKYSVSPSINTPPPSTYGPGTYKESLANSNSKPFGVYHPALPQDLTHNLDDPSLPTKYEEYDMRPIKPLDADLKRSLYGEKNVDQDRSSEQEHKPREFLRRSHPSTIPGRTAHPKIKHTQEIKSPREKLTTRIQSNLDVRHKVAHGKVDVSEESPRSIVLSPRRKRQQHYVGDRYKRYSSTIKRKKAKTSVKDNPSTDDDKENNTSNSPQQGNSDLLITQLPVDLKHVRAATKIQSIWRGFRTRKLDPKVVEIRQEVRARRAEQYISFLCHEVQMLKEKLEAENKMRDLQTEAIRYIWSQVRALQKQKSGHGERYRQESNNKRKKSPEHKATRSQSSSPRRGKTRAVRRGSPKSTPRDLPNKQHCKKSDSSTSDFGDETESVESSVIHTTSQKKADVTWKEDVDKDVFAKKENEKERTTVHKTKSAEVEDTDEGRGTLVTDGEGNPAHSSAEDTDVGKSGALNTEKKLMEENKQLKSTIDLVQEQVVQLQDAMLALSDQILNRSYNDVYHDEEKDIWEAPEDLQLVSESQVISLPISGKSSPLENHLEDMKKDISAPEVVSARGEVPRITLKNILSTLRSALGEHELWALCEQACQGIKKMKTPPSYIALETTYVRKDGRVEFSSSICDNSDIKLDEMYLAPEVLDDRASRTVKSSIFSLSVTLWSCADWEMSADQAPQLSEQLESLLVVMSQDDNQQRAEIDDVIKMCEDYHAEVEANSLRVCASLFAEAKEMWAVTGHTKIDYKTVSEEVAREQESRTKSVFRDKVVPDIKAYFLRSNLKPASTRVLSPRRPQEGTPHEKLMDSITSKKPVLRTSPRPKIFTVRDMFQKDPELVRKLNILPGQRRKNMKAMRLVMRRQTPRDPGSPPKSGIPTAPRALRAEVKEYVVNKTSGGSNGLSSVVLRWHPAQVFDKHSTEAKPEKIMGYRIYVNGQPKGMVAGTKSRALLEGLRHSTEYRVHVRAVSALGESDPSNTVIAHITPSSVRHAVTNSEDHAAITSKKSDESEPLKEKTVLGPEPQTQKPASGNPPQPKPRLGAIFPKREEKSPQQKKSEPQEQKTHNGDGDNSKPAKVLDCVSEPGTTKPKKDTGDDIIDRVLRRYGIQQSSSIVPGYASGSSLPPIPVSFQPNSPSTASLDPSRPSTTSNLLNDVAETPGTQSISETSSSCTEEKSTGVPHTDLESAGLVSPDDDDIKAKETAPDAKCPSALNSSDITPRSLALLAQLKSDLLG